MRPLLVYALIYVGTLFYTSAAYLHLNLKDWTFLKALAIALPLVFLEYQFSLRGNHYADAILGISPLQILLATMCFYFFNLYMLNHFVLKRPIKLERDLMAFALIIVAFVLINT